MEDFKWIVSPKELKRNQQRAYEREAQLKKEKKEELIEKIMLAIAIIMIPILFMIINIQYKNGVEECVNAGHDRTFCEVGLQ